MCVRERMWYTVGLILEQREGELENNTVVSHCLSHSRTQNTTDGFWHFLGELVLEYHQRSYLCANIFLVTRTPGKYFCCSRQIAVLNQNCHRCLFIFNFSRFPTVNMKNNSILQVSLYLCKNVFVSKLIIYCAFFTF